MVTDIWITFFKFRPYWNIQVSMFVRLMNQEWHHFIIVLSKTEQNVLKSWWVLIVVYHILT